MTAAFNDSLHVFRSEEFRSVVDDAVTFFKNTPLHPLPPTNRFIGSGVYGLYYQGDFEAYAPLAALCRTECVLPIYIGKAVPKGWRAGRVQEGEDADLLGRLREHARSIRQVNNLRTEDFQCRFMILKGTETDLIGPVEGELIRRLSPLWNGALSGFGLHDVGKKRVDQIRTLWDTLHPGRRWTHKLTGQAASMDTILAAVKAYMDIVPQISESFSPASNAGDEAPQ